MNDVVYVAQWILTSNVKSCALTWACKKLISFAFAIILSTVLSRYRIYGIRLSINSWNLVFIIVPQVLPSRRHINAAVESDGFTGEHLAKVWISCKCGLGCACCSGHRKTRVCFSSLHSLYKYRTNIATNLTINFNFDRSTFLSLTGLLFALNYTGVTSRILCWCCCDCKLIWGRRQIWI